MIDINDFHKLSKSEKRLIFTSRVDIVEDLVKSMMSEKRFAHSLSVAKTAYDLAYRYHIDPLDAYLAGVLHDITKSFTILEHRSYLDHYDPSRSDEPELVLHSYSAVYFIREKLNFYNGTILNAIYHHTDGKSNSILAKILYIADKREPLRGLDSYLLDLAYHDLESAFVLLKKDVEEYIKKHE